MMEFVRDIPKKKDYCERCGRVSTRKNPLTKHHIYKRCVFGENDDIVILCQECHRELETQVLAMEMRILKQHRVAYKTLNDYFINSERTKQTRLRVGE